MDLMRELDRPCTLITTNGHELLIQVEELDLDPCTLPTITAHFMSSYFELSKGKKDGPIKKVIFNNPATIVIWSDNTKTVVKCQPGDTYSEELGLAMCISKKYLGNKGNFNEVFKKWLPEKIPNYDIPVEEMRNLLDKFCETKLTCEYCELDGKICRCGRGAHFKRNSLTGKYTMSDKEIKDAYHRVFGKKED